MMVPCKLLLLLPLFASASGSIPPITPTISLNTYLSKLGVPFERHFVTTSDGYVLQLHRLPNPGRPVVFLQHGILASTWCWLANDPERALGIVLYRAGFDVFMGNNRGNIFGRNHTTLPIQSKSFWNFSFDDMGKHDLPDLIEAALNLAGGDVGSLSLIAWSQGNTQTLVAGSDPAVIARIGHKVNLWIALSPVSYLVHSKSLLLTISARLKLGAILEAVYPFGFLDGSSDLSMLEQFLCKVTLGELCKLSVDAICGTSDCDDKSALERLVSHFPAGTSVKDLTHFEQLIDAPFFQRFDYGIAGNQIEYDQSTPPLYNVSHFPFPTALFLGGNDDLVSGDDVVRLEAQLPAERIRHINYYKNFSHVTWIVGDADASRLWLADVLEMLEKVTV